MNKLFQQLNPQKSNLFPNNIKQAIKMIKSMGNPQAMVQNMLSQNPQVQDVINQAGGDARKAFYTMAQQKGVDPNEILNMMK